MEVESMSPVAGNSLPSQKMKSKTGYGKGSNPDDVFLSMEYEAAMVEIGKLPPEERKAALVKLHQRQWEEKKPYKH